MVASSVAIQRSVFDMALLVGRAFGILTSFSERRCRPSSFSLLSTAYCLLLVAYCLLSFSSCTKPVDPPSPVGPDTTSHNVIWQIDTLGDGNSSVLYDVAIIDENNVWAVGELHLKDSSGNMNPTPYGLAKWNGSEWSYETVAYHDFGSTTLYPGPLFAIQAFGVNDIYVCSYANLLHWDGVTWTEKAFFMTSIPFENQILRIWGRDGNSIYCVGRTGGIFYFNGTSWTRVESGTTLPIQDIWGAERADGSHEVMAVASERLSTIVDRRILKVTASGVSAFSDSGIDWSLYGIWFDPGRSYMVVGSGVYWKSDLEDSVWSGMPRQITNFTSNSVRGTRWNDIFVGGDFNDVLHFNGSSWMQYEELHYLNGAFYGCAVSSSKVVLVGWTGNRAVAVRGYRDVPLESDGSSKRGSENQTK